MRGQILYHCAYFDLNQLRAEPMTSRVNGCGTTLSLLPDKGAYSLAIKWFTLFYIPIIPMGFRLIKGNGGNEYIELGKVKYKYVVEKLGKEFVKRQLIHDFVNGVINLLVFGLAIAIVCLFHYVFFS